jgi:hypothetical protein
MELSDALEKIPSDRWQVSNQEKCEGVVVWQAGTDGFGRQVPTVLQNLLFSYTLKT